MTLIAIEYALYAKDGDEYEPVSDPGDLDIEKALADADTSKEVEQHGNPERQREALMVHVLAVPFPLPVDGHVIAFDDAESSRWNPTTKTWDPPPQGASLVFPVPREEDPPRTARLYLRVYTVNCG